MSDTKRTVEVVLEAINDSPRVVACMWDYDEMGLWLEERTTEEHFRIDVPAQLKLRDWLCEQHGVPVVGHKTAADQALAMQESETRAWELARAMALLLGAAFNEPHPATANPWGM